MNLQLFIGHGRSKVAITAASKQAKQPVVLRAVAQQMYQTLSAQGSGAKDFSAIVNLFKKAT